MGHALGWNLRTGGRVKTAQQGTSSLLLSAVACLVFLSGCSGDQSAHLSQPGLAAPVDRAPIDLRRLTRTDDEVAFLQILQSRNPEWAADEGKLRRALGYHRQLNLRTHTLAIQFQHQYPAATQEEIAVLVQDAMVREKNERDDAITRSILSAPPTSSEPFPMHCFSDTIFSTTYTDCY